MQILPLPHYILIFSENNIPLLWWKIYNNANFIGRIETEDITNSNFLFW
jgi:hypothetical protein